MKIKVLYLLEYPIDLPGGAQMSTQAICEGIMSADKKFEITVATPRLLSKNSHDYPFALEQYKMGESRMKNLLMRIIAFRKIIQKVRPHIIHAQMPESFITLGLLRTLGIGRNSRIIYTDRGLYFGYRSHSMKMLKYTLHYTDAMICTTYFNEKLWKHNSSFHNIKVIPNTISDAFKEYDESLRESMRQKHGIEKTDIVLGFAGRVCEEKNWPLVARLIHELAVQKIKVKAAIVMSVYEPGDADVVKRVTDSLKHDLGEENVFTWQDLSQKEMADFYYLVDVFVMTSRFESFGKAAVEAMSRKCAVLSTNVGGLAEVIGKEDNLYEENHLEKAVCYLAEICAGKELLAKDKEYFYNRYCENFTLQEYISSHIKLYEETVNHKSTK